MAEKTDREIDEGTDHSQTQSTTHDRGRTLRTGGATRGGAARVMDRFQLLMERFLEVERSIMLTYLGSGETGRDDLPADFAEMAKAAEVMEIPRQGPESDTTGPEPPPPQSDAAQGTLDGAPPIEPSPPASTGPGTDRDTISATLLRVVADATGYPQDMLGIDLDMEADLGIDSIKRVEILGAFRKARPDIAEKFTQDTAEELTGAKTLAEIIDRSVAVLGTQESGQATDKAQPSRTVEPDKGPKSDDAGLEGHRFLVKAVEAPLPDGHVRPIEGALFLVTDDEGGVADTFARALRDRGGRVVLLRMGEGRDATDGPVYTADLGDPNAAAQLVAHIREQEGPISGLVHLLPLKVGPAFDAMSLDDWRERIREDVKALFLLAKATGEDIKQAAKGRGGWLAAATSMGGTFASDATDLTAFFPGQGGVTGIVKSLAREWPSVCCKVVDFFEPVGQAATVSDLLLSEYEPVAASDYAWYLVLPRYERGVALRVPLHRYDVSRVVILPVVRHPRLQLGHGGEGEKAYGFPRAGVILLGPVHVRLEAGAPHLHVGRDDETGPHTHSGSAHLPGQDGAEPLGVLDVYAGGDPVAAFPYGG